MTLETFLEARRQRLEAETPPRPRCAACRKPESTCYCAKLKVFRPATKFVILIHRDEVRRGIATGRMAHLSLGNSELFEGLDFTDHEGVNALLADPFNFPVVLYPGPESTDLATLAEPRARREFFPDGKQPVVFVIDGTWSQSRRIRRLSRNLMGLPQICFTPPRPSRFYVRQQPRAHCYATIEAIHHFIDLTEPEVKDTGPHKGLLEVFAYMVNQQLEFEATIGSVRGFRSLRGPRVRA